MDQLRGDKDGGGPPAARRGKGLESLKRKLKGDREDRVAGDSPRSSKTAENVARPAILYERSVPRGEPPHATYRVQAGQAVSLADAVDGRQEWAPCGRPYYIVEQRLEELHSELAARLKGNTLTRPLPEAPGGSDPGIVTELLGLCGGRAPALRDMLLLDLETTGLSSSPLFLIGTLHVKGDGFVLRQLLARTYAEEQSVISAFAREMGSKPVLVSFNGKSFDVPYLRARAAATGVPVPETAGHLDLLHAARRVYRGVLPDCRLETLERYVCQRRRTEDIAGHLIPEAYHHFVRTGNAIDLGRIISHNAWDLVTLLDLMLRLAGKTRQCPKG